MSNIVDYARHALESFDKKPMNEVDSLVLSWFAYLRLPQTFDAVRQWDGLPLRDLFYAEHFDEMLSDTWDEQNSVSLLSAMAASPRFRDARVMGYTEKLDAEQQKQFAAVTLQLNPDLAYIAFRGTDSTIVGWKEDFNLAFTCPVPAQEEAVRYATLAAEHVSGELVLGGHSKGGNLAVYAAAKSPEEVRSRFVRAYSHDGPGFMDEVLNDPDFVRVADIIDKTLPRSSVVGLLLESHDEFSIVQSTAALVMQHDPFTWETAGDAFERAENLNANAVYFDSTLSDWLRGMTVEQREELFETVYNLLVEIAKEDGDDLASLTTSQLYEKLAKNRALLKEAMSGLDKPTHDMLISAAKKLLSSGTRNVPELFRATGKKISDKASNQKHSAKALKARAKARLRRGKDDDEKRRP